MDGYVIPGHDHVLDQQAHELASGAEVGFGSLEAGRHAGAERFDGLQHRCQALASLPLLLEVRQLGLDLSMLAVQLLSPDGQFMESNYSLLIGIQQPLALAPLLGNQAE